MASTVLVQLTFCLETTCLHTGICEVWELRWSFVQDFVYGNGSAGGGGNLQLIIIIRNRKRNCVLFRQTPGINWYGLPQCICHVP
ncbi:hypothetical protein HOY80DRAFT_948257 [Tuber brumale]|nr:hypothetical protein HOY80DRAFT_948257 [Tuber brumale]